MIICSEIRSGVEIEIRREDELCGPYAFAVRSGGVSYCGVNYPAALAALDQARKVAAGMALPARGVKEQSENAMRASC